MLFYLPALNFRGAPYFYKRPTPVRLERKLQELGSTRGPQDLEVLSLTEDLARLLSDQGDFAAARDLQEGVLEAKAHLLGEEHPNTLETMSELAETLWAQGDLAGARRLWYVRHTQHGFHLLRPYGDPAIQHGDLYEHCCEWRSDLPDRKTTRLNSSHLVI